MVIDGDNLINTNDNGYQYDVLISKEDLQTMQSRQMHTYYNSLHLPVLIETINTESQSSKALMRNLNMIFPLIFMLVQ